VFVILIVVPVIAGVVATGGKLPSSTPAAASNTSEKPSSTLKPAATVAAASVDPDVVCAVSWYDKTQSDLDTAMSCLGSGDAAGYTSAMTVATNEDNTGGNLLDSDTNGTRAQWLATKYAADVDMELEYLGYIPNATDTATAKADGTQAGHFEGLAVSDRADYESYVAGL
jgi:hypothetical protein